MTKHGLTAEERFWAKVNKTEECWEWVAAKDTAGYGVFNFKGRLRGSHRVAWELARGDIPEGMFIDHMCHNPACVNISHLRLATPKQNVENRSGAQANSKTGVRGVSWDAERRKWASQVMHKGRKYHAGRFDRIEDAEAAVIEKRNELFTHNHVDRRAA